MVFLFFAFAAAVVLIAVAPQEFTRVLLVLAWVAMAVVAVGAPILSLMGVI